MDLEDKLPLAPTNVKREEIFNQLQQLYLDHDDLMEGKYNKFL